VLAQIGDAGRRNCLSAERCGDLPLVICSPGPAEGLVGDGVRGLEPLGIYLVIDPQLKRLREDHGIAKPSGDCLQLQMALARRRPDPGLIHHSDQGGQYVSLAFGKAARDAGIAVSMGSRGDAYDKELVSYCTSWC
jgi:hypothetical protein